MSLLADKCAVCIYRLVRGVRRQCLRVFNQPLRLAIFLLSAQLMFALLNPFGIEKAKDRIFIESAQAATGALYGRPWFGDKERAVRSQIVVILINESSLAFFDTPFWPLSYDNQADIVERIAAFNPAAIFLDLLYLTPHKASELVDARTAPADMAGHQRDQRGSSAASAMADEAASELDMLLARRASAMAQQRRDIETFTRRLSAAALRDDVPIPTLIGPIAAKTQFEPMKEAVAKSRGLFQESGLDVKEDVHLLYPQTDREGNRQAAYKLFNALCVSTRRNSKENQLVNVLEERCNEFDVFAQPDFDLIIRWGDRPRNQLALKGESAQPQSVSQRCVDTSLDEDGRFSGWAMLKTVFADSLTVITGQRANKAANSDCSYHDILAADLLFNGLSTDRLQALLGGRTVMIGVDLPYLRDHFQSPIHGDLPGVMVHAMALDNLLQNGVQADRQPSKLFGKSSSMDAADVLMLLINTILSMAILLIYRHGREADEVSRARQFSLCLVIALLCSILGGFYSGYLLNWPLGYAVQIFLASFGLTSLLSIAHARKHEREIAIEV